MSYKVFLHPKAAKQLKKLDEQIRGQILGKLEGLKKTPYGGKHLRYSPFWRLRVGDYRVIYETLDAAKQVNVLFVGHRDDVYDDFSKLF